MSAATDLGNPARFVTLRPVGLSHWGTLLLTDRAFFYIWSQPPLGKTGYVVDYNLLCFSCLALSQAHCRAERVAGVNCVRLLLTFGRRRRPGARESCFQKKRPTWLATGQRKWLAARGVMPRSWIFAADGVDFVGELASGRL